MHDLSLFISLALALKSRLHGIWSPPWGRSAGYCLVPVTVHIIVPPRLKNSEQILEIFLGICRMITPSFITATVYLSVELVGSLTHSSRSPRSKAFHNTPRNLQLRP